MTIATKQALDTLDCIEFSPVIWFPKTGGERLAALVGYITGDGNIHRGKATYARKSGDISGYERLQCAFYSNEKGDLDAIQADCLALGLIEGAQVRLKKNTHPSRADGWQLQLGAVAAARIAEAGAPIGKKTTQEFAVPQWVMKGSEGVRRAYLGALFGAEGTAPSFKSAASKCGRQPVLLMCKRPGFSGAAFFEQLQTLAASLGVACSVGQIVNKSGYVTDTLRVSVDSLLAFYENVSYVYASKKAELAWLVSKYLRTVRHAARTRTEIVRTMMAAGESCRAIGRELNISAGGAYNLMQRVLADELLTTGQKFASFEEWLLPRWDEKRRLLKLGVVQKSLRDEPVEVWNMLVDSSDHSYLLASGANNFNSFEAMSGRVYYAFDRRQHVGKYEFNPALPIWIGQDFNIDPMSSIVLQPQPNGEIWAVDEIVLYGSNTLEVCDEIERRYWRHLKQIVMYPDPAGGARQHARGETDLDIMREKGLKKIKYRRAHPPIADRVNAVNKMLMAADGTVRLRIDERCRNFINSLEQTMYKPGGRDIDKSANIEHITDAAGYCIELEFPVRRIEVAGLSI